MTNKVISPLRQRMIDDMTMRRMSAKTQQGYIRAVKRFADFFDRSPDKATAEDIRRFHVHLARTMGRIPTMNATRPKTLNGSGTAGPECWRPETCRSFGL